MTPRVSLITTIFNREAFLEAAVRSVRTQTFADFEHILYDDGSTDGSLALAQRLAKEDARVRVVAGERRGVVGALKRAHEHARAPLIGWLDSDDLLVNTALEETVAALAGDPTAGLVFTDHVLIDARGRVLPERARAVKPFAPERLLTELVSFQFRLFRREVFDACGGIDDSFTAAPDYDFCLRASEVARFVHLPRPLYCYRQHPGAISSSRRIEQIENSRRAVERALVRRGLDRRFRLQVDISAVFSILERE
ncbi:MAG: glycosyltransferase [Phycisphaerae bacterium]|nr:glycosyltransferase [Phycisphaerae bacterium]